MRIHPKRSAGNVLFATLFTTGIVCLYMGSYLTLVRTENQTTRRSQTWNMAIPIAEAGVEEALAQIQSTFPDVAATYGWTDYGKFFARTRWLKPNQEEGYTVVIFPPGTGNASTPTIVSEGFVRLPGSTNYISRTVRVNTKLNGYTMPGMVVVTTAQMNGNKLVLDSFNSTNSAFSTNGKYDENKRGDKALLATLSSMTNAVDLGNADIWGKVASPPNGSPPKYGPQSVIGSASWHKSNKGLEKTAYDNTLNMVVDAPQAPFTSAVMPSTYKGVTTLGSGTYAIEKLEGTVIVTGRAQLLVTKAFDVSSLTISNAAGTASLEVYVAAAEAKMGEDVNVQGRASNFKYYGLSANPALNWAGNKTLEAGGNGQFTAMIYAPGTALTLNGGGNKAEDFSGACLVKSVNMVGHYSFHFDESCANEMQKGFITISWDEINTGWETIRDRGLTVDGLNTLEFAAK